jgi:hypothetical protein
MLKPLAAAAVLILAVVASAQAPTAVPVMQPTGVPGKATATTIVKVSALVTAVDKEGRSVTLKHADGQVESIKVGPQVKRFDEVAVGDTIAVEYEEGLALEFQLPSEAPVAPEAVATSARAPKEEAPAGVLAAGVRATVVVTAIDLPNRMVVLQGPRGQYHQVKAGAKIKLEGLKVGDKLLATYVQAVAISLEKAPAKAAQPAKDAKPAKK